MKIYDKDIRKLLFQEFTKKDEFISDPSTVVVDELDVWSGVARIDIVVINGKMHGYEIKSERDNLERLPYQAEYYSSVFDTVTLVSSEKHLNKVEQIIPDWWGILCVNKDGGKPSVKLVRPSKQNKSIDSFRLAQMLWKDELLELLSLAGVTKGVKSKTRHELEIKVAELIDPEDISNFVREKLKSRKSWRARPLKQLCDDLLQ